MSGNNKFLYEVSDVSEGVTVNEALGKIANSMKNVFADIKDSLKDIDNVSWFLGGLALGIGLGALSQYIYNEHGEDIVREGVSISLDLQDPVLKHDRELRTARIMERKIEAFKVQDERDATSGRDQD